VPRSTSIDEGGGGVSPATKPGDRLRLSEDGEIVLAGLIEVDRGVGFEAYIEPELERRTDRLDGRRVNVSASTRYRRRSLLPQDG